ncbi:acyltransferase family protein [Pleionea litopenaei]|uniref:Acyltransferase n=1 Tax=Pleionea litopenaei TaxID=3070815 RepID=A0AA51X5W6_9GAMM|nr:acyltransferase [Pleionea sp. HL-JVS1]WMS86186.1 acyltransferase [Pleionea sp. HL-JVS1]
MKKYFPQLAWLRGFAAFAVVFYHIRRGINVNYTGNDPMVDNWFFRAIDLGDFGVLLFFVLSGTTLYLNHQSFQPKWELSNFFIKRIFRIWPAFFVSLIISIAFIPIFSALYIPELKGYWIEVHADQNYSFSDIFRYLSLVFNITGPHGKFNVVYWSLPIEFQYYLIFPLLVLSLRWLPYVGPVLIGAILYGLLHTGVRDIIANAWTLMLAYTFCGGVLIGYLYKKWHERFSLSATTGLVITLALLVATSTINQAYDDLPAWIQNLPIIGIEMNMFGLLALAVVLIMIFTNCDSLANSGASRLFNFLGEISYSVYLYHCIFIAIGVLAVLQFELYSYWSKLMTVTLVTLIGTVISSYLSYRFIEKPGIQIGRKILRGRS